MNLNFDRINLKNSRDDIFCSHDDKKFPVWRLTGINFMAKMIDITDRSVKSSPMLLIPAYADNCNHDYYL